MAITPRVARATIDFETRSACELKTHGSWRYSLDIATEPLCLAFRLPHWKEGRTALWHPAFPHLKIEEAACPELSELFLWIIKGGLVEAHNAFFERGIWRNIMLKRYGWPDITNTLWRCSAAKAAAAALPRHLADACKALGLAITKDEAGGKVMKKVSKPRKPRKAELEWWEKAGRPTLWFESRAWFEQLWAYCRQDVLAEEALSQRLPDLSDDENEMYVLDQVINERGVRIDQQAVTTALRLIEQETGILNAELAEVTEGTVTKVTQRGRLLDWLKAEGLELDNTQKQTIDDVLSENWLQSAAWIEGVMTPKAKRALEILRELGRSSTAKYEAMRKWSCPDGRVHGSMLYHGATTGRWAGAGIQPHNFPKGALSKAQLKAWDMFYAWLLLLTEDREAILGEWGSVMAPLSQGLRGAIIPAEGKRLYCISPKTRVLKQDLTWIRGDRLIVGDQLLAFDEHSGKGKGNQRKFRSSQVINLVSQQSPRIKVTTSEGDIVVSSDHRFLVRQHKRRGGWVEAKQLKAGDQLAFISRPWDTDNSREGGYLAGFLDGEGCVSNTRVSWSQNPGPVFDTVSKLFLQRSFRFENHAHKTRIQKMGLSGGLKDSLRLLGSLRPHRLLDHAKSLWEGRRVWGTETPIAVVTNVEALPDGEVLAIATTTGTLITEGFLSHNCADYAAIEARVLLWLAEDDEHLDIFRRGEDIYCEMASHIYGYPCTKKQNPKERDLGKIAILGLGYQMGAGKFAATAATFGITLEDDFAEDVVAKYREKFYLVKQLWWDQDAAAIRATHRPNTAVVQGRITWRKEGLFLYATLPSGRRLAYPFPQVKAVKTPWGSIKDQLSYMGVNAYSHQWTRQPTYGGMIVENLVQAISRDIMAAAMVRLEATGVYEPVLTVHDELVAEAHPAVGNVEQFVQLVATLPEWADGCPIEAEGWSDVRYHK